MMGLLRVYLALCVVAGHSEMFFPWKVHHATEAVQMFFVISGFYMALVSSKYASITEFYASRFLRIFIPYWIVLGIVLGLSASIGLVFGEWMALQPYIAYTEDQNGFLGVLLTAFSNITIFFQDWVLFFKHDSGKSLAFTWNFWESKNALWRYLIVPQAWSIGVELTFYLLVPVLTRLSNTWVFVLTFLSLLSRAAAYSFMGLGQDPWTNRFFPFEIALFLFGILGFRLYVVLRGKIHFMIEDARQYAVFSACLLMFLYVSKTGSDFCGKLIGIEYARIISYMVWAGVIPVLFCLTRQSRLDRYIGELSFPIYLVHVFVITSAKIIVPGPWLGGISALGSVAAAVVLMKYLIAPFENRRQDFAKSLAERIAKPIPLWAGSEK